MLYRDPTRAGHELNHPVVAIGNFDGVHRGHQKVIDQALSIAADAGADTIVLTFEPHPVRFFRPDTPAFRLNTLEQKSALLHELGIDAVVAATFDHAMSQLTPEQFVRDILVDALGASTVLVGSDFCFGKGRAGNVEVLSELGAELGFEVVPIELLQNASQTISSTSIRNAVRAGDLPTASRLLGRPYGIVGKVIHGDQKGREYGFPTANLATPNPVLPPDGIYATVLRDPDEGDFDSATYVGTRPTVDGASRNVEAYCLDVPEGFDIYGHEVELDFVAQVRCDEKFVDVDAMIEQMHHDVARVREVLNASD